MITANKYIKMLGMSIDDVCKTIDKLPEKDSKDFMKMVFIQQKYKVPFEDILTDSPNNQKLAETISQYIS